MQFQGEPLVSNVSLSKDIKEKRHRVFWFKKENGDSFCTQEDEAWNIMSGRVKVFEDGKETTKRHQYLGASSSETYFSGLKEMNEIFKTQGLEKAQEYLRDLEQKELNSADKTIKPRNMDRTLNGQPANFQI